MIAHQTTVHTLRQSSTPSTLHFSAGRAWVATLSTFARRMNGAVVSFAKIPPLPYAALWEGSVVTGLLKGAERTTVDARPTDDGFAWRI
jgi:hypothetical protein